MNTTPYTMLKPYITRATGGEYSTVQVGDYIETCWFGDDGSSRVIARTLIASIAREHVQADIDAANE